jgi:hypothetical protein
VKTRFSSKVIMFEKVLEFIELILLCYKWQKIIILQQTAPKAKVWAIVETFTFVLNHVVTTCVMNQS